MTEPSDGRMPDARTMAALMAAVQVYLEDEATEVPVRHDPRLGAWKTATWGAFRAGDPRRRGSWDALRPA